MRYCLKSFAERVDRDETICDNAVSQSVRLTALFSRIKTEDVTDRRSAFA